MLRHRVWIHGRLAGDRAGVDWRHDQVTHDGKPVAGAAVVVNAQTLTTNENGTVTLRLPIGTTKVAVTKDGFVPAGADIVVKSLSTADQLETIALQRLPDVEETVTVSATRTGGRIERSRCASRCSTAKRSKRRCS